MVFDWTQLPLANTPWRIKVVAHILLILIRRAKEGRPIYYSELAEKLESEFGHEPKARKAVYGSPVGAVGQAIEQLGRRPEWRGERIPPINTIVVSKSTGYPSAGADEVAHYFFGDNGAGMAKSRKAYLDAAMNAIYHFDKWDQIAAAPGRGPIGGCFRSAGDRSRRCAALAQGSTVWCTGESGTSGIEDVGA